jgi:hypothetical protein
LNGKFRFERAHLAESTGTMPLELKARRGFSQGVLSACPTRPCATKSASAGCRPAVHCVS